MTREEVAAVVEEAHRMGFRVAAHAEGLGGARIAVEEGVDTIEHGLSLHRAPELLGKMAERGIILVPTLSTFHDLAERFAGEFAPRLVEQAKRQADDAQRTLPPRRGRHARDGLRQRSPGASAPSSSAWPRPVRCGPRSGRRHRPGEALGLDDVDARPERGRPWSSMAIRCGPAILLETAAWLV
jgi:hypothetical protein